MPTVVISPIGGAGQQFFDNNGDPLSGGKLYTYVAGTTTPATTYTSISGATPRTNPIILDSAGRVSNDGTWLDASVVYKFVLKTSVDVTIGTWDNIAGASTAPITIADASTSTKGITKLATAPSSASNPIAVGDNDPRLVGLPYTAPVDASTSAKGITKLSVAPASAANPIAVGDNDSRLDYTLTADEKDALAGTSGSPSSSNPYVTDDDPRLGLTSGFRAHLVTPYNVTTTGDDTIIFDTEDWDIAGEFDLATSTFTPNSSGTYVVSASVYSTTSQNGITGHTFYLILGVNAGPSYSLNIQQVGDFNAGFALTHCGVYDLTAGNDYTIIVNGLKNPTSIQSQSTWFSIYRIR